MHEELLTESYYPARGEPAPSPMTIGEMLRNSAARWPDSFALREVEASGEFARNWTYRGLLDDAERLARALASRHAPGARVAIYANNVPEWVLMEFGCALAGLILVTVNPASIARELRYVLEQSGAEALYYVESFRGNPLGQIAREAGADLPAIRHTILLSDHDALFAGEQDGALPEIRPHDAAQIQYTSGTTGRPKGALLHHHGLVRNGIDLMIDGNGGPGTAFMLCTPLFHTTGCACQVLGGLGVGATILLPPAFDPVLIARLIEREALEFALLVPTMLLAVIEAAEKGGHALSSIKGLYAGGAMIAPDLWRKASEAFGTRLQNVYGQTESSPVITRCLSDDSEKDMMGSIGRPARHTEVSIRDRANAVVPIGAQGEICCRGYQVMLGYYENPEATAEAIDADGWLHTGDLGTMDERGFVRVTGRVKDMIIRGGENLFPAEIENAMLEHEAIAEVAVVGIPDDTWGELVVCFMRSTEARARPCGADLKAFARERLSPQKTPLHWVWVEQWPLTGSGKIQKFKLRDKFVAGELGG
jgi:fatty-acyl-CoA synthase